MKPGIRSRSLRFYSARPAYKLYLYVSLLIYDILTDHDDTHDNLDT